VKRSDQKIDFRSERLRRSPGGRLHPPWDVAAKVGAAPSPRWTNPNPPRHAIGPSAGLLQRCGSPASRLLPPFTNRPYAKNGHPILRRV